MIRDFHAGQWIISVSYRNIYTSPGNNIRSELELNALGRVLHVHACMHAKLLQSCAALCNTMACSPPGSSAHRILQARILEWVAISFSRDLPNSGMEPGSLASQVDSLLSEPPGKITP